MIDGLKPYPAQKDSGVPWLGDVPDHWRVRRQRSLVEMQVSNVDKHTVEGEVGEGLPDNMETGVALLDLNDDHAPVRGNQNPPLARALLPLPALAIRADAHEGGVRGARVQCEGPDARPLARGRDQLEYVPHSGGTPARS